MLCPVTGPKMFWAGPFFVPDQKFIYRLWQSQTFCTRQKDDLHSVKFRKSFEEAPMPCPFTGPNMLWDGQFFAPDQKFIYILRQSQTFCARQKDDLHS